MDKLPLFLFGVGLIVCGMLTVKILRRRKRRLWLEKLESEPFPPEWDTFLLRNFELYDKLPEKLRRELQFQTRVLMESKRWEAAGDLPAVTDEMRLLIMAQAALLTIGRRDRRPFPKLFTLIVYPTAYRDTGRRTFSLHQDAQDRLGESWTTGSVVLAWDSVQRGAASEDDGCNVVLHEFAHQLDQADGVGDGAPILANRSEYADWATVLGKHYNKLVEDASRGRRTLLDTYGATNAAEFFAVATEAFFERSRSMSREVPDLYRELKDYYQLDPAAWR